jgi:hypothetical protein
MKAWADEKEEKEISLRSIVNALSPLNCERCISIPLSILVWSRGPFSPSLSLLEHPPYL